MKISKFLPILSQISADERPNIILILADDFGVGDFQINQASAPVPTPNIDRLGTEGINFKVKERILKALESIHFNLQIITK
jgi:arylsulfatase A